MQRAHSIKHSIKADPVLSPRVIYEPGETAIYFPTDDERFGRVSFEKLDSIKVSRGEYLPFKDDWTPGKPVPWIYKVENSLWLKERYDYEFKHYADCYEFGGSVNEMLTDFSHFIFSFHDEFVEVIARGFWIEVDGQKLEGRDFLPGHPHTPLSENNVTHIESAGLKCYVVLNPQKNEEIIENTEYCFQKLMEFYLDGKKDSPTFELVLGRRSGKLVSILTGFFGQEKMALEGVATLEQIKPFIEDQMEQIAQRRKSVQN